MNIKEAINEIAETGTFTGLAANEALKSESGINSFVNLILDQIEVGGEETLKDNYGKDVIDCIVEYAQKEHETRQVEAYKCDTVKELRSANKRLKECLNKLNITFLN